MSAIRQTKLQLAAEHLCKDLGCRDQDSHLADQAGKGLSQECACYECRCLWLGRAFPVTETTWVKSGCVSRQIHSATLKHPGIWGTVVAGCGGTYL